jgi:hypothetical protein
MSQILAQVSGNMLLSLSNLIVINGVVMNFEKNTRSTVQMSDLTDSKQQVSKTVPLECPTVDTRSNC